MGGDITNIYSKCDHIPKVKFENVASEETIKDVGRSYDLPPLYESRIYEDVFKNHYSLVKNNFLACRWKVYVDGRPGKVFEPFHLPDIRAWHFYNCATRFLPGSDHSTILKSHRMKMKYGPGVDAFGQIPMPEDPHMKRAPGKTVKVDKRIKIAGKGKKDKMVKLRKDKKNSRIVT